MPSEMPMTYQMTRPAAILEPFIECFWFLAGPQREAEAAPEIVLPDGRTELIVHFAEFFYKLERASETGRETYVRQAMVLMSGQLTERIILKPSGEIGVVGARFKPAGAARFFDLPYDRLVDQVIDFYEVDKAFSTELHDKVKSSEAPQDRMMVLQQVLIERLRVESQEDIFVRQACRYILQSDGDYTLPEIVKLIGFSERQLERKFKKQVGISPKTLTRIIRFQKFLALTKTDKYTSLSEAALFCGYYDQSHFIKDFTRFSGISPLAYITSSHPLSDHLTTPLPG